MSTEEFDLQETIQLLGRTPAALNALLRGLPNTWTQNNEGENTWSAFEIVGHLIHGERTDWMPRARIILAKDETRTFEVFDRQGHVSGGKGKSQDSQLDEFATLRGENLRALQAMNLQPDDFKLRARHPALGPVTLSQLLATWALHDLTHLHQVARVMAHQYRNAVGPWRTYLGVLRCDGHSEP
jgi:hypothetical protein